MANSSDLHFVQKLATDLLTILAINCGLKVQLRDIATYKIFF